MRGTPPKPVPVVFGDCFGWYHPAAGARGVVLCGAQGQEEIWTHRIWRGLAERLAAAGMPTLRFDYQGTGDSLGDDEEPGRVDAWLASTRAALEWMRARPGVEEIALAGLRLGGTLAATVAAEGGEVHSLALLAAPSSGKAYARELRAMALLAPPLAGAPPRPEWKDDLEAAGFVVTAETRADLARLDLLALPRSPARRVLLMERPDAPATPPLAVKLRALGAEVEAGPLTGYGEMMRLAHYATEPADDFARLVAWLGEGARPAAAAAAPAGGARLRPPGAEEEPVFFGEGCRLFGIHCEPAEPRPGLPALLFLNTGADHHVGSDRMTVPLARRLAARGYPSLRFDLAGIGESPALPGERDSRLYSLKSRADVRAALDFLESRGHLRCVAVGMCSGAFLTMHTAFEDERIAGQVLINPLRLTWREGDSLEVAARQIAATYKPTRYYLRNLRRPETWKRLLAGEVNVTGITRRLAGRAAREVRERTAELWGKASGAEVEKSEVARGFHGLCARGVETLFVCSLQDSAIEEIESHLGPRCRKLARYGNVSVEILEGADHTLTSRWAKRQLEGSMEAYLGAMTDVSLQSSVVSRLTTED